MTTDNILDFEDVLSEEQQAKVRSMCEDTLMLMPGDIPYFEAGSFVNNLCIISYGDEYEPNTILIDSNGDFADIELNKYLKISDGKIVTSNPNDYGTYYYSIHRILQNKSEFDNTKHQTWESIISNTTSDETSFLAIKVTRLTSHEDSPVLTFVIDSKKNVIANFSDLDLYKKIEGYGLCHVYIERDFFFLTKERDFLVFSQKLMAKQGREQTPLYDIDFIEEELSNQKPICEWEVDEDEWQEKLIHEYYNPFYGIIDCNNFANGQLFPITNDLIIIDEIIHNRYNEIASLEKGDIYYGYGWSDDNKDFYGEIMSNGQMYYPTWLKGLGIRYAFKFYPKLIIQYVQKEKILIPNDILETFDNNEYLREIQMLQEQHLQFKSISSIDEPLRSSDYMGITSTYNGMTLDEIVYERGGTKYLVYMIRHANLEIDANAMYDLKQNALNAIELKCYNIILAHILDKENRKSMLKELLDEQRMQHESNMEQKEIERDTYYALGGDDYNFWKQNGGDLDTMIEQIGV